MLALLSRLIQAAPAASLFVVEADDQFEFNSLPNPPQWEVRHYPPAVVGIAEKRT